MLSHALKRENYMKVTFIAGVEGSGTTLLQRLLSLPNVCSSLGGMYFKLPSHPEAEILSREFAGCSRRLWDRKASLADHEKARQDILTATNALLSSVAFADQSHLIFKRSFPFGQPHGQYVPDIWDMLDLGLETRVIVVYRDPCAATYSALRRGFDTDIRRLAVMCGEQLTWLAGQVRAIDPNIVRITSYRRLCQQPHAVLAELAEFCGIPWNKGVLDMHMEKIAEDADKRYSVELEKAEVDWLGGFFDARRRKQWENLV
jgi:hypothetical protein